MLKYLAISLGMFALSGVLASDSRLADDPTVKAHETVVLLHGFGRSARAMWSLNSRLEAAGYRVERLDYSSLGTTPEEICLAVRFILAARGMTGQMIALDGGQHLGWAQPLAPDDGDDGRPSRG